MERTPVRSLRRACFGKGSRTSECATCKEKKNCIRITETFSTMRTIHEIVKAPKAVAVTSRVLIMYLVTRLIRIGYRNTRMIQLSPKFQSVVSSIIDICASRGIDPRLYVQAQIDTMGRWAVKNRRVLYANMLVGRNASKRFEEWAERNRKRNADHHHLDITSSSDKELLAAEMLFVDAYMNGQEKSKDVEALVRKRFPSWSLALGRKYPKLRVEALRSYLAARDPSLPNRICLQKDQWKWGEMRKDLHAILR